MITAPRRCARRAATLRSTSASSGSCPTGRRSPGGLPLRNVGTRGGARRLGRGGDGGAGERARRDEAAHAASSSPLARGRRRSGLRRCAPSPPGTSGSATRSATSRSSAPHARNYQLDPALLAAVIYTESKFDANARSAAGAIGLMQLLPETAKGIALRTGGARFVLAISTTPRSTSATAPGTSATCSTSTATSARRSPPTTRARRTSTAGARRGSGSSSRRPGHHVDKVERIKRIYARRVRALTGPSASAARPSTTSSGGS